MTENLVYPFGREFQTRVLAWFALDPDACNRYVGPLIKAEFFEYDVHQAIVRAILHLRSEYNSGFVAESLIEEIFNTNLNRDAQWLAAVSQEVTTLFELDLSKDRKYLAAQVLEFARFSAMRDAIRWAAEKVGDPKEYPNVQEKVREALRVGVDTADIGILILESWEKRHADRGKRNEFRNISPTGFDALDEAMLGGLAAGELGCYLAPSNRGKTTALVGAGVAALARGRNVYVATLETGDSDLGDRYDSRMTGLSKAQLYAEHFRDNDDPTDSENLGDVATRAYLERGIRLHARMGGEVLIRRFGSGKLTVAGLQRAITDAEIVTGFRSDVIIVDYGDLLKASEHYSERRHELSQVFTDLRGMAEELQVPVWTASQGNRESLSLDVVDMDSMAEDWGKVQICDLIIGMCQTDEELLRDRMRLFIAKLRSNVGRFTIYCEFDKKMQFIRQLYEAEADAERKRHDTSETKTNEDSKSARAQRRPR